MLRLPYFIPGYTGKYIIPAYNPDPQVKPQFPCAVDWNHPITRSLIGCWVMNEYGGRGTTNLVGNVQGTFGTDSATLPKWLDDGIYFFDYSYINSNQVAPFALNFNTPCSIMSILIPLHAYQYDSICGNWDTSIGYLFRFGFGASDYKPLFLISSSGGVMYASGTALTPAIKCTVASVYDGSGLVAGISIYADGKPLTMSTSGTVSGSSISTTSFKIGNWGSYSANSAKGSSIYLVYIWNRTLTHSEIQQLYLEPYAFIRPVVPHPYWIPEAAAGVPTHMDYYRRMRNR